LPIDFFYFEDFQWSFFGKIKGQKQLLPCSKMEWVKRCSSFIKRVFLLYQVKEYG